MTGKRITSLVTAVCMVACTAGAVRKEVVRADYRRLNIETVIGASEVGVYGIPTSTEKRFPRIKARVSGVYKGCANINVNMYLPSSYFIQWAAADDCKMDSAQNMPYDIYAYCYHCACGSNVNNSCTHCSNGGTLHHTNADTNLNALFGSKNTMNCQYMYITAAKMCMVYNGRHSGLNGLKQSLSGNLCVVDTDYVDPDNHYRDHGIFVGNGYTWGLGDYEHIYWVSKNAIHEIGHLYGIQDHYFDPATDPYPDCIWGTNRDDYEVVVDNKICPNCLATLKANANRFNHS